MTHQVEIFGNDINLIQPEGLILDVVILTREVNPDNQQDDSIIISSTDHTSNIIKTGIIETARDIIASGWETEYYDDEE